MKTKILNVLKHMDPQNPLQWTAQGLPDMATIHTLAQDNTITREMVNTYYPLFSKSNPQLTDDSDQQTLQNKGEENELTDEGDRSDDKTEGLQALSEVELKQKTVEIKQAISKLQKELREVTQVMDKLIKNTKKVSFHDVYRNYLKANKK